MELLEGMRVLTTCWGICMATCFFVLTPSQANIYRMYDFFYKILFTAVSSGNFTIDFFFFFAFYFTTHHLLMEAKKGKILSFGQVFLMFLSRLLRMIPLFYSVFFFGWLVIPFAYNDKNMWYTYETLFLDCDNNYPYVLTFVNNFYPAEFINNRGCFFWGFFIDCDVQLYILAPLLMFVYLRKKLTFYIMSSMIMIG
jgi:hypothetical protein